MIVGISGRKRSGKDTVYEMIRLRVHSKLPNVDIRQYAFADPVREFAVRYFGVELDPSRKEEYRFILQGIGEMIREEVNSTYWVYRTIRKYEQEFPDVGIITDLRYPNEVDIVKEQGGVVLRVSRGQENTDMHPSETSLTDEEFSDIIYNNGTLEELRMKVIEWTDRVLIPRIREQNNGL